MNKIGKILLEQGTVTCCQDCQELTQESPCVTAIRKWGRQSYYNRDNLSDVMGEACKGFYGELVSGAEEYIQDNKMEVTL